MVNEWSYSDAAFMNIFGTNLLEHQVALISGVRLFVSNNGMLSVRISLS